MSIAITSRAAVSVPFSQARIRPPVVERPTAEPAPAVARRFAASTVSAVARSATSAASLGATTTTRPAQNPPDIAQSGRLANQASAAGQRESDPVFADITGDRNVDGEDITALLQAFNTSVTAADLNADGNVDTADLGMLISAIREFNSKTNPGGPTNDGAVPVLRPSKTFNMPGGVERMKAIEAAPAPAIDLADPAIKGPSEEDTRVPQPNVFGDLTGDGIVNGDDLGMLREAFGSSQGSTGSVVGDLNGDGRVDTADLGTLLGILNNQDED